MAVLGASNYTYAEALPCQELPHWIAAHVRAFEFLGGAAAILVPDNLRSGVTKAHRYEPDLNRDLRRAGRPLRRAPSSRRGPGSRGTRRRSKQGVLARRALDPGGPAQPDVLLARRGERGDPRAPRLAQRPARSASCPGSRASLFEELDRPALRPLPATPYEYATWKKAKVNIDYHVEVERHCYSVPYALVGERVRRPRHGRDRRGLPPRPAGGEPSPRGRARRRTRPTPRTCPSPTAGTPSGRPCGSSRWAEQTGPATAALVAAIMASPAPPRAGLPQLPRDHAPRAPLRPRAPRGRLRPGARGRRALVPQRRVDPALRPRPASPCPAPRRPSPPSRDHANVRGAGYYE